jgi:elongation factor 1-gamma
MLGEEPNLDIECVFMFRGQEVPFMMKDHVSYEYFDVKKLDFMNNADDEKMVREFMGVKVDSTISGRRVEQFDWWK